MTVFLALIAAAGIVLTIRAMVLVHRATALMEDLTRLYGKVSNLAFALHAQNDAMLAARGCGGGGGNSPGAGKMVPMACGMFIGEPVWPSGATTMNGSNSGHTAVTEGYLGGGVDLGFIGDVPAVSVRATGGGGEDGPWTVDKIISDDGGSAQKRYVNGRGPLWFG